MNRLIYFIFLFIPIHIFASGAYNGRHGWPEQKAPGKVIICSVATLTAAENILLESLSGLCAQAANEDRFDEMVWIETGNESYKHILQSSLEALQITEPKHMNVWELLEYLKSKKIVKGYILYRTDISEGALYERRKEMNYSCNVATVYAGLMKGVLIDESLEKEAKRFKLRMLKDARYETMKECFDKNRNQLNNCSALSIDPKVSNCRDIAIAQKLMAYYDTNRLSSEILEWVKPLSPILGWNCGDEDEYTGEITRWGHYNTASNWCYNLPFIMAASNKMQVVPLKDISYDEIDFNTPYNIHSFVMSDGDNMQWTMGNFIDTPLYYGNFDRNRTPVSWTLCPVNLSVISASTWNRLVSTKPGNTTFIEYGGGYQYPDEFANKRPNRKELLTEFARRMNWHFKKLNLKVFGFICKDVFSEEAKEAYEIYASEIEGLTGMIAVQYDPYNAGGGTVWVSDKDGTDIPVITATYAIWADLFELPSRGAPDYVASLINRDAAKADLKGKTNLSWTIIHAWSDFDKTIASNYLPQKGYNTAKHADKMLSSLVKNVSLEELIWHIRFKYIEQKNKNILKEY